MKSVKIYLTEEERAMVRAQRARLFPDNRQHCHVVLRPRTDGEVEVIYCFSRKVRQKGAAPRIEVMATACTASDGDKIFYRNLRFTPAGGYAVHDWTAPMNGTNWGESDVSSSGRGEPCGPVANPDALSAAAPRYRHAAMDEQSPIRPATYLRALHGESGAELLYKAGLEQLIMPSILRHARDLGPFIARHRVEIKRLQAGAATVLQAWRRGISIKEAHMRKEAALELRSIARAPGADILDIWHFFKKLNISTWEYASHCDRCRKLGLDAGAYMPSPKNYRTVAERVEQDFARFEAERREKERARLAAEKRKRLRLFAEMEAEAAKSCPDVAGVVAVFPQAPSDLAKEGKAMGNCIGNGLYMTEVAHGFSVIVFLREAASPDTPWCDVELKREGKKWVVVQCYAKRNTPAPDVAKDAAKAIAEAMTKAAQRKARKTKKENGRAA